MGREVNDLIESVSKVDSCSTPISLDTPVTPDSNRETMVMIMDMVSPSIEAAVVVCSEAGDNGDSPRTPKDTLFDPFAPGSELLLNAPLPKTHSEDSHGKIFRRLVYGLGKKYRLNIDEGDVEGEGEGEGGAESEVERSMVRNLYGDLLEVIAYVQAEEVLAAFPEELDDGSDSSTPSFLVFNGIAETCPPAPRRKVDDDEMKTSVGFDTSLCKKLEF